MKEKPLKYFLPEISPYSPIEATCSTCKTVTVYFVATHALEPLKELFTYGPTNANLVVSWKAQKMAILKGFVLL